ncbi:MAG: NAD(P)/FAD-dependent oxidoreductase [Nannocystaceae bacterium]
MKSTLAAKPLHDVLICGGGLAGLTLALQLRRAHPTSDVVVIEPTTRPLPDACHKVGESTVELGAHYLQNVLGLREYLRARHLLKNGLRFFPGNNLRPIAERMEIGPPTLPLVPSYQLDRGRLENDLRGMCEEAGVTLLEGARVTALELRGDGPHEVEVEGPEGAARLRGRWLVDATGRRRLLQRQLGLHRDLAHHASAAWFRVKGRVDVADLVDKTDEAWHRRDIDHVRYLSTVHLMGRGYWAWLIPLSTGHTSVGVVTDERIHPLASYSKPEGAMAFLRANEPALAAHLEGYEQQDFRCVREYCYGSRRVFSAQRWACVGEAGVFIDPLYSPGSDYIGMMNCYAAEMIRRDLEGAHDPGYIELMDRVFHRICDVSTENFRDGFVVLGKARAFAAKLYWDNLVYWALLCPHIIHGVYRDEALVRDAFVPIASEYAALNIAVQRVFRVWGEHSPGAHDRSHVYLPQAPSMLANLHGVLGSARTPEEAIEALRQNLAYAREAAGEVFLRAVRDIGPKHAVELGAQLQGADVVINYDARRCENDGSVGRARTKALPFIAREFERSFGRVEHGQAPPMPELLRMSGVADRAAL